MTRGILGSALAGLTLLAGCGGDRRATADREPARLVSVAPGGGGGGAPGGEPQQVAMVTAPSLGGSGAASAGSMIAPVAHVNGQAITMGQLVGPLLESHGLTVLVNLVQLELAKQNAAALKPRVVVSEKDFADEREATLDKLFKDSPTEKKLQDQLDEAIAEKKDDDARKIRAEIGQEREAFLNQFLENQHIGRAEYDIVLQINTYLRKIAEPKMQDKINDEALRRAFGQLYGERVHVHFIELANPQEVTEAKRRLAAGDTFEDVARDMSHNRPAAAKGGDLDPFSRDNTLLPESFKKMAFSLKDGEVSPDVLVIGSTSVLIKRLNLIPPKAVKFENEKESIRARLQAALLQTMVKKLREDLAAEALRDMRIEDPTLARQFEDKRAAQLRDADKIKLEMDKRQRLLDPATQPATSPTQDSATSSYRGLREKLSAPPAAGSPEAAPAPVGERPPATRPGSGAIDLPKLVPDASEHQPTPGK